MREITSSRHTKILCLDEPGVGGACHTYLVIPNVEAEIELSFGFAQIRFQNGGIKDAGVNGCQNEDLIAIVLDRLYGFQSSEYKCRENALAITKFEEGLMWLEKRTNDRIKRGVEGTLAK